MSYYGHLLEMSSYARARAHFDSIKAWRGSHEKPIFPHKRYAKHKAMRMLSDGTIVFRHWHTDVLQVHPDNSLTVQGYGSVTTSALLNALLPTNIRHVAGGESGPVLALCDAGDHPWGSWERDASGRYRKVYPDNPPMVVRCGSAVRLKRRGARWVPVGEVKPFEWRVAGKRARQVAKRLNIAEFRQVMPALIALAPPEAPAGYCGRWVSSHDYDRIVALLVERRYAEALDLCALKVRREWVQGQGSVTTVLGVKESCLRRVRDRYVQQAGATVKRTARTLTMSQYSTYRSNLRRFG